MKLKLLTIMLVLSTIATFAQKETIINAKVLNNNYTKAYLENAVTGEKLDSVEIKNDEFSFKLKIKKTDILTIVFDKKHYYFYIPVPGEKSNAVINIKDIFSSTIKGSKNTALIYSTVKETDDVSKKLEAYKLKLEEEKKEIIRKRIKENPSSLSNLLFINQLDINKDIEYYKMISNALKDRIDNELINSVHKKVEEATNLAIGSEAPEISLNTPEGKTVKLSSLRGKYVLIDFWAAWCRPCRMESPNMVKLYNKYHKKGFTIYSISLDNNREDWVKAIKDDGLGAWTHVSDLKYWNSEAGRTYKVTGIPFTVLIDKKGRIIAKKLRGQQLEAKLAEIFK